MMVKKPYRTNLQMLLEILEDIHNTPNIVISKICRDCNLSHYACLPFLNKSIELKLIEKNEFEKKHYMNGDVKFSNTKFYYTITKDGLQFLSYINSIREILSKMGIIL